MDAGTFFPESVILATVASCPVKTSGGERSAHSVRFHAIFVGFPADYSHGEVVWALLGSLLNPCCWHFLGVQIHGFSLRRPVQENVTVLSENCLATSDFGIWIFRVPDSFRVPCILCLQPFSLSRNM